MLETSDHEINVDRLMHEIRETVARQKPDTQKNVPAFANPFPPNGAHQSAHAPLDVSPLSLQPEFHPRPDNQYHVNDLLKYHGGEFVRSAYRAILKREPDASGFAQHLESLASGRFNKIDVLASLRFSAEGERARVRVEGLKWPAAIRRAGRAPLIGYLVQMLVALARLPRLLQHQRQSEFYVWAQQQQIVDHGNRLHRQLTEALTQINAQLDASAGTARSHQQAIEQFSRQQQDAAARQLEFRNEIETRLETARQFLNQATAKLTGQLEERSRQVDEQVEQLLQRQHQLTGRIDQSVAHLAEQSNQTRILLTGHLKESAALLIKQAEQSTAGLTRQVEHETARLTRRIEEELERVLRAQRETHTALMMQERRLTLLLEKAREQEEEKEEKEEGQAVNVAQPLVREMLKEEEHLLDALYASFEDQFRGDREEVKERLRVYLPLLREAKVSEDVLDIGCGRGEWLELLREEGMAARGVDHNRVFVERCRQSGLDVTEEDALRYLRGLPDESLNVITSFHTVEHLPFETLIRWLDESARALKPGGLLILETPDPENFMVGSCSFYADPTHRNPIPSPTLKFLLESRGLYRTRVMKLRPWDAARIEGDTEIVKRFNEYFYSAPDYAIIGWKV